MGVAGFRCRETAATHTQIASDASLLVGIEHFVTFQTNQKKGRGL